MFDKDDWAGFQPPSKKQVVEQLSYNFRNGVKDVQDMVEELDGKQGDEKYEDILFYQRTYSDLMSLFDDDFKEEREMVMNLKVELIAANNNLVENMEGP